MSSLAGCSPFQLPGVAGRADHELARLERVGDELQITHIDGLPTREARLSPPDSYRIPPGKHAVTVRWATGIGASMLLQFPAQAGRRYQLRYRRGERTDRAFSWTAYVVDAETQKVVSRRLALDP